MQTAGKGKQNQATVTPRTQRLEARISADLKDLYTTAASLQGQTLTEFVVSTVSEAARRIVREHEVLALSKRDQQAFAAALLAPPLPAPKLSAAAAWYKLQAESHD
jgi:uncharacterized protein (DUF1778 family)